MLFELDIIFAVDKDFKTQVKLLPMALICNAKLSHTAFSRVLCLFKAGI